MRPQLYKCSTSLAAPVLAHRTVKYGSLRASRLPRIASSKVMTCVMSIQIFFSYAAGGDNHG